MIHTQDTEDGEGIISVHSQTGAITIDTIRQRMKGYTTAGAFKAAAARRAGVRG